MMLAKFACGVSNHFWMFASFEFVVGLSQAGVSLVSSVILSELVGPKYKTMAGAGLGFIHTFSACLLTMQGWLLLNWRHFLMITTAPYMIMLLGYRYMIYNLLQGLTRYLKLNIINKKKSIHLPYDKDSKTYYLIHENTASFQNHFVG